MSAMNNLTWQARPRLADPDHQSRSKVSLARKLALILILVDRRRSARLPLFHIAALGGMPAFSEDALSETRTARAKTTLESPSN